MNDDNASGPIDPDELVLELRKLRDRIPNYGQLTRQQAQSMVRVANLPVGFVNSGLVAGRGYDGTKALTGMTGEELWQLNQTAGRWTAVDDELVAMLSGVRATNLKRRHIIGQAVLQIYTVLRGLIKEKKHSALIPFVAMMKEANKIRGKSKQDAGAEEKPEPPAE